MTVGHTSAMQETTGVLVDAYDTLLLDLDGVVYLGRQAVPGAPEALVKAQDRGVRLAFVTNNASRTPGRSPSTSPTWAFRRPRRTW